MRNRKILFLQWALTNLITIAISWFSVAFAASHVPNISAVAIGMASIIASIYSVFTVYAAVLSWKTCVYMETSSSDSLGLKYIRHDAEHILFAAVLCPFCGLIGSLGGIFFFVSGAPPTDASHLKEVVFHSLGGIGISFISTMAGVFFMMVLWIQYHLITHAITRFLLDHETPN